MKIYAELVTGPLEIISFRNPSKIILIIFGSRPMVSKVEDFRLTLLRKEISPAIVTVAKDLGVLLYPCLTYNNHIASTVSGCMVRLGQINY